MDIKKGDIWEVLNGMVDALRKNDIDLYKALSEHSGFEKYTDYEEFYLGIMVPFDQYVSGLISSQISKDQDVQFIHKHSGFIERHFSHLFENIEGMACCVDKSRTIMRNLITFYLTGNRIEFNYSQEYTYHLPKTIFKDHDSIVSYYDGLRSLYYGNSAPHVTELAKVLKEAKND